MSSMKHPRSKINLECGTFHVMFLHNLGLQKLENSGDTHKCNTDSSLLVKLVMLFHHHHPNFLLYELLLQLLVIMGI